MKIKGKSIIITSIIAIAVILVVASAMGYINLGGLFSIKDTNDPGNPSNANVTGNFVNLHMSDREIHLMICLLTNRSPPFIQHQAYIQGLHMQVWGANDITGYGVLQDYEQSYTRDGFTSYTSGIKRGSGWTAYAEIWYNDVAMGRAITVGDGSAINNAYGYDCVLITSYGPVTDYYDYVIFMSAY